MFKKVMMKYTSALNLCILLTLILLSLPAPAMVLHNDDQPSGTPSDNLIGRWSSNASCVAIAPNLILSVKHQGGDIGTSIVINSTTYKVTQLFNLSVDLRVARITTLSGSPANLTEYASLYTGTNETGQEIFMAGYGRGRGTELQTSGQTYGYTWAVESNNTLRWATNQINGPIDGNTPYGLTDLLYADFDDINMTKQQGRAHDPTDNEGIPAEYDSGGAWLLQSTGELVAISAYLQYEREESWFRSSTSPSTLDPDPFYGIRISSYDDQITPVINRMSNPVIISGYALDFQNAPVQNVTIYATGGNGYTKTNAAGYYEIWVENGWSGTTTPSPAGSTFEPTNYSYSNITDNIDNQNFQVDTITVSGFIHDNNQPMNNVIIDANSETAATTDANGFYQLQLYTGFSGNITPSKFGYNFTPPSITLHDITSDLTNQNFDINQPILMDDFNDNTRSANWTVNNPDTPIAYIDEIDQHLEFTSIQDANTTQAFYSVNCWSISSDNIFALKADFHNTNITPYPSGIGIRLTDANSMDNFILFSAGADMGTSRFSTRTYIDEISSNSFIPRAIDDGTLFVSYAPDANEIYLSHTDFGPTDADETILLPYKTDWIVELIGFTEDFAVDPTTMWLDNLKIQTGTLVDWPPITDIDQNDFIDYNDLEIITTDWLLIDTNTPADITGDNNVNFTDLAKFSEAW